MNIGEEDFELSYADDRIGKTGSNSLKRLSKPKPISNRKRVHGSEGYQNETSNFKRVKTSTNIEHDQISPTPFGEPNSDQHQNLIKQYNNMKRVYEEERVNQQSHLYLRRMAHDTTKKIPTLSKYPLLQYLVNASKIMMLNEYEIIAWALWLDSIQLIEDEFTVEEKTLFTALYVKSTLNDDKQLMNILQEFLAYIKNFIDKFNNWVEKNSDSFQPFPVAMNRKYIELSRPYNPRMEQDFVEYNHVVDDILQISPPYTNDSKYAPKYSAPEIKPGGEIPGISNPQPIQSMEAHKILLKPEPSRRDLMPFKDISGRSFGIYPGYTPDKNGSKSFNSVEESFPNLRNIETNKNSMGGIVNIINGLRDIYDIDNDAPQQPSINALDSIFQNAGRSNTNSRILQQDLSKGKSNIDLKNQTYDFIQNRLSNKGGLVKINLNDLPKDDEDIKVFDQEPSFEKSGVNIIRSDSMIPLFGGNSNKPVKKE